MSYATSKVQVNVDRLTTGLLERGLRFEGLTRSNAQAVPPGLLDVVDAPWDGNDPVDTILALVDSTRPRVTKHRAPPRHPAPAPV